MNSNHGHGQPPSHGSGIYSTEGGGRRESLAPTSSSSSLPSSASFSDGFPSTPQASQPPAAAAATTLAPEDFLNRGCFFFYDAHHEDETAEADDILLYFYPEEVPRDTKLFLQGACSAMVAFASKFTNKTVDVVTLKRTKIAFKALPGKITLVNTDRALALASLTGVSA
jgi:hypothetical protein